VLDFKVIIHNSSVWAQSKSASWIQAFIVAAAALSANELEQKVGILSGKPRNQV
jgi:hypothetical protein